MIMKMLREIKTSHATPRISDSLLRINREERNQLACIMFTDIVGCTKLMERDEHRALELLIENAELQNTQVANFGGTVVKEMGDGILATFTSASAAVECAESIIEKAENIEGLELRIGIHMGEVIFTKRDVFGMVVNVASRIQDLAQKGQILVSESVSSIISSKDDTNTKFMGFRKLKNVKNRMKVYSILHSHSNYRHHSNWSVVNLRISAQRVVSFATLVLVNLIHQI